MKADDPRKKIFAPIEIDFGSIKFLIARHFGFCYGVENAIEISYKALAENPDKKVYLLSQMIHNQMVNDNLQANGVDFIMDTAGNQLINWDKISSNDVIIIPAFGTTLEVENKIKSLGAETRIYNTTCPFVERVWKKSSQLGKTDHTVIIHGKHNHEETKATFSHSNENAKSIIVRDLKEAKLLGDLIIGIKDEKAFDEFFSERCSKDFDYKKDLNRIGVVNQTTMLASETLEITNHLKEIMKQKFGTNKVDQHFADTKDTLCYATNDNQKATFGLLEHEADLAIVVGGYNSSNTSHIVELLEDKFKTYFINSPDEILSSTEIQHFNFRTKTLEKTANFLPKKENTRIILTSGASCPDALVEEVLIKLTQFFPNPKSLEEVLQQFSIN